MTKLTAKENLLLIFTSNQLRLNKYDNKFFLNLVMLISKNKFITTNQILLFDKLIFKYKKQLKKLGYSYESLINLSWDAEVIDSDIDHTQAHLEIVDKSFWLRLPFNRKFIEEWRSYQQNKRVKAFTWSKENKCYIGSASTFSLQVINHIVPKFFTLNYPSDLRQTLNNIECVKDKIFDPTLVKTGNNYYVLACNDNLHKAINNIRLNDNPKTLNILSKYGISIDKSITGDDPYLNFCSRYNYKVSLDEITELKKYLFDLDIGAIILSQRFYRVKGLVTELINLLSGCIIIDADHTLDKLAPRPIVYMHYGYMLHRPINLPNNWMNMVEKELYFVNDK